MTSDGVFLLRQIAKRADKRVRRTNLLDPNVCSSQFNPDRRWEIREVPGDVFHHQIGITARGRKVRLRANRQFIVAEIQADLEVIPLSINRPDRVFFWATSSLQIAGFPNLQVFSNSPEPHLKEFLALPSLAEVLNALRLDETESLHIYANGLSLYLQPGSPEEALLAVQTLCIFVEKLPEKQGTIDLTMTALPSKFQSLLPLIPEWSVADDDFRTELLENKSRAELRRFLAVVEPELAAIDSYLASFANEPLSDAAAALGRLAECAAEVKMILSNRTNAKR